jgi:predicted DNA-binding transcriptional regulator AlpA
MEGTTEMDLRTALPPTDGITSAASVTATALDPLLGMRAVAEQVGGISRMSLHRWANDPKLQFPPADVVIYNRRYWHASTIRRWQAERVAKSAAAKRN